MLAHARARVDIPSTSVKITPLACLKAVEDHLIRTWRVMPASASFAVDGDRLWIEFRGCMPARSPSTTPDDTTVRVLLPGRNIDDEDKDMGPVAIVVRLYQADPTPRRHSFVHEGMTVSRTDTPTPAQPLLILIEKGAVVARDVIVVRDDFGTNLTWPFSD